MAVSKYERQRRIDEMSEDLAREKRWRDACLARGDADKARGHELSIVSLRLRLFKTMGAF